MPAMDYVAPIEEALQSQVVDRTLHYIRLAETLCERRFAVIPVAFNLRGRSSGMYRVRGRQREIRYNPWLFARHFDECVTTTVPHEVAHYITDMLWGMRNVRPHGREWQSIMAMFEADPSVTSRMSLEGIPQRRTTTMPYRCGCRSHQLGIRRHNRVARGQSLYRCRQCGDVLVEER